MWGRFPYFKKIVVRALEVAGAGLTSALVAYLLGRTEPPATPAVPAVVHLAPADEEMIRTVRTEQAALLDRLRDGEAQKPQTTQQESLQSASQMQVPGVGRSAASTIKPGKSTQTSAQAPGRGLGRRDQKFEHPRRVEDNAPVDIRPGAPRVEAKVQPRTEELQTRSAVGNLAIPPARDADKRDALVPPGSRPDSAAQPSAAAVQGEAPLTSALKGITDRVLPSRDRMSVPETDAVRPPMPVGEP